MFKKALEKRGIHLTNQELAVVLEITTDDIKFNRVSFGKCTSLDYVLDIAERCANTLKRCA